MIAPFVVNPDLWDSPCGVPYPWRVPGLWGGPRNPPPVPECVVTTKVLDLTTSKRESLQRIRSDLQRSFPLGPDLRYGPHAAPYLGSTN